MMPFISADGVAKFTAVLGTAFQATLGGGIGFTHVINFSYKDLGTLHTLTLMRGASRGKVLGQVLAAGATLVVDTALTDGAGNAIAASDFVAVQLDNGMWHRSVVTSWTAATLTLVLTTAVPTGRKILDGAKIVCYGVAADAMHADQQYAGGVASTDVNVPRVSGSVMSLCKAPSSNEPIIFNSDNPTAAGTLNYANVAQTLQ
jgi:hypothetical protein